MIKINQRLLNIMALRHSACYSPLLMTMAGVFLREEGLEADYMLATPEHKVENRIRSSQCLLAQSAVATCFTALEQHQPVDIVHFAQINQLISRRWECAQMIVEPSCVS